jgi:hypothetical protein
LLGYTQTWAAYNTIFVAINMAEKKEMPGLEYHSIAGIFIDGKFSLQRM